MPTWLAALIALGAVAATYFFCIRPMRRGECEACADEGTQDAERSREIAELREELRILRAEDAMHAGHRPAAGGQDASGAPDRPTPGE